jgi:hypothetical protein
MTRTSLATLSPPSWLSLKQFAPSSKMRVCLSKCKIYIPTIDVIQVHGLSVVGASVDASHNVRETIAASRT